MRKKIRKVGRRKPIAAAGLIALGLMLTGGAYAAISAVSAPASAESLSDPGVISKGHKLFLANCATCHGLNAEGTQNAPSLAGVGAAAVDFQVGTGRMPLQMNGPQAMEKKPQFNQEDIRAMAAYVASLGPGPAIPDERYLDGKGDIAKGAELFRVNCAMCHNVVGAGGALTEGKFAPNLKHVSPAHIYEAMETGPQSMPVFNDLNITPEEKRDVISYLKYVDTHDSPGGYSLQSLGPVSEGLFLWIFVLGTVVAVTVWIAARSN